MKRVVTILVGALLILSSAAFAQTTAFNYQGKLTDAGNPANGSFQMQFKLFDSLGGAGQVGSTITDVPVTVTQGIFSVKLDFGANALSGANRWLEIAVRHTGSEFYTTLSPREQIASSPYAVRTLLAASADVATDSLNLGGVPASEYVTNSTVGSSFVRNQTALQTANFNISGNGFIGGNLGIGTTNPQSPLSVQTLGHGITQTDGTVTVGTYIGLSGGWYGTKSNHPLFFFANNSNPLMTLDQSGNLGIGTISPAHKLQVNGITSFGQPGGVYGYSLDFPSPGPYPTLGFNNYFSGGSYVAGATGFGGVFQYQNGDGRLIYYNSNTTATGGSPLALNPRVTIDNDGNVGIGTTTPSSKLTIGTIAADGYSLKTFGNVRFGGHAVQTRDQSGLAKAMVYVLSDGTILRCYNGINISTAGNCGFTVTHFAVGGYGVNFGFPVSDRFVSVSVARQPLDVNYGIEFDLTGTVNNVNVRTYRSGQTSTTEDATFMVIVY